MAEPLTLDAPEFSSVLACVENLVYYLDFLYFSEGALDGSLDSKDSRLKLSLSFLFLFDFFELFDSTLCSFIEACLPGE